MENYWQLRLRNCCNALEQNHFQAYLAATPQSARTIFREEILPNLEIRSASWGDSLTLQTTGILDDLRRHPEITWIETFDNSVPRQTQIERWRAALLADLFLTGTNALTETGHLVNLDMIGNRTGGITFGPHHVVIVVGRNKLVDSVATAMQRIKNHAAPLNAIRHEGLRTPCRKTGRCMDCRSPHRICNTWTITAKSFPQGRIKVILINADLGL